VKDQSLLLLGEGIMTSVHLSHKKTEVPCEGCSEKKSGLREKRANDYTSSTKKTGKPSSNRLQSRTSPLYAGVRWKRAEKTLEAK